PKQDLQQAEAMTVMNSLIASNIFITSSGALIGIRDIKVIDTTTDDLFDPPEA
ncbi:MAG: DUF2922 domain-containing protein, partial [Desulfitobacteriaceae bacterium]